MKIAFVHRHGPGQFVHLACHLANAGWRVSFLCEQMNVRLPGIRVLRHRTTPPPPQTSFAQYHQSVGLEAAQTLDTLIAQEGPPDILYGHIGWGSMLFARDVLPRTPLLGYCEHYYHANGRDVGFAPDDRVHLGKRQQLRLRNMAQLTTLDHLNAAVSPTRWQKSAFPAAYHNKIGICHDGIDIHRSRPAPDATFTLPDGKTVRAGDPVVTYVARDLEPYRGFPQFMTAAAKLARHHPDAMFIVAGGDGVSYGTPRTDGRNWREAMMDETGLDPARIAFLGQIPHDRLTRLFQVSAAHVYLTYPFVLSWSVLEAMACGALVVASDTGPCHDIIEHGQNGILTDFWDSDRLADTLMEALRPNGSHHRMRQLARRTVVQNFALQQCLEKQTGLLERMIKT